MNWVVIGLAAVAFTFFGMGWAATYTARSDDEGIIGGVFYLIGLLILVADIAVLLVVTVVRALT